MADLLDNFRLATLPKETDAFRAEVKAFLAESVADLPADRRSRSWLGFDADFSRRLAARGWVGVTLPARHGGADLDAYSRFVLVEELLAVGAPVAAHWIADRQSGPLILRYGSEAQRDFYLPKICRAEAFFCIGMSEPNAGSDLASVGSQATRMDAGWRLNGRKVWTTNGHKCHYTIALVRTSGSAADRQKGLSQFIVDLSAAVKGYAIGEDFGLALVGDIRVANREARYGANFACLGFYSGMGVSYLLPRIAGLPRAAELLFTGRVFPAATRPRWASPTMRSRPRTCRRTRARSPPRSRPAHRSPCG